MQYINKKISALKSADTYYKLGVKTTGVWAARWIIPPKSRATPACSIAAGLSEPVVFAKRGGYCGKTVFKVVIKYLFC